MGMSWKLTRGKYSQEGEEEVENWKFLSLRKWQLTPVIHGNCRINDYWPYPYTLCNNFSSPKQFHAPLDLKYYYLKLAVSYRKPVSGQEGNEQSYIIICCPRSNNIVFPEV